MIRSLLYETAVFDPATFVSENVTLDSFTVVDVAGSWRLTDSLELVGRISNLTLVPT